MMNGNIYKRTVNCLLALVLIHWQGFPGWVYGQSRENPEGQQVARHYSTNEAEPLGSIPPSRGAAGDAEVPEMENSYLDNNPVSVIVVFGVVFAGYLAVYVPVGSWGGIQCLVAEEGWNDCWNAYMKRTLD